MKSLYCNQGTPVTDLSPLAGEPIQELWHDIDPKRDAAALRAMSKLQRINDRPAAAVLKELPPTP